MATLYNGNGNQFFFDFFKWTVFSVSHISVVVWKLAQPCFRRESWAQLYKISFAQQSFSHLYSS